MQRYSRNTADYIENKERVASAEKYIKKSKVDNFTKFVERIWKKCRILKNKWASVKFNEGYRL